MAIGIVNEFARSKKGAPQVKIDGKYYFVGKCNIDGLNVGDRIDYTANTFGDRGTLLGLQTWKLMEPAKNGYGTPDKVNPAVSDDAEMRFISNCVGQAIAAGTIKIPSDIAPWFAAAKAALKQPTADNFDDGPPPYDDDPRF